VSNLFDIPGSPEYLQPQFLTIKSGGPVRARILTHQNTALVLVEAAPNRCTICVWNLYTHSYRRTDLYQETPQPAGRWKAAAHDARSETKV
jgi:hypothetical protein